MTNRYLFNQDGQQYSILIMKRLYQKIPIGDGYVWADSREFRAVDSLPYDEAYRLFKLCKSHNATNIKAGLNIDILHGEIYICQTNQLIGGCDESLTFYIPNLEKPFSEKEVCRDE